MAKQDIESGVSQAAFDRSGPIYLPNDNFSCDASTVLCTVCFCATVIGVAVAAFVYTPQAEEDQKRAMNETAADIIKNTTSVVGVVIGIG